MSTPFWRTNWRRVLPAAGKLAAFYGASIVLQFLLVSGLGGGPRWSLEALRGLSPLLGMCFGLAFVLLAGARRAGFAALWSVLAALWLLMLGDLPTPFDVPRAFLVWSIFALPLWVMGHFGVAASQSKVLVIGRLRFSLLTGALAAWAALAVSSRFYGALWSAVAASHIRTAVVAEWLLWAPAPLILSAIATRHVWRGTASGAVVPSA